MPGDKNCITKPAANPAIIIIGPNLITLEKVIFPKSNKPSFIEFLKLILSSIFIDLICSVFSFFNFHPKVKRAIIGPNKNTLIAPVIILFHPKSGVKIVKIIIIDKKFRVDEPCVKAITDSSEDPLFFKEFTTGTIQAEQRFRAGPSIYPLNIPFNPGENNIV